MKDRTKVLDVDTASRTALIAKVLAVMPTQDDPYLFQADYAGIVSKGPPRHHGSVVSAASRKEMGAVDQRKAA